MLSLLHIDVCVATWGLGASLTSFSAQCTSTQLDPHPKGRGLCFLDVSSNQRDQEACDASMMSACFCPFEVEKSDKI
jgi:hypothetical protein